jgi:hypothetical protein
MTPSARDAGESIPSGGRARAQAQVAGHLIGRVTRCNIQGFAGGIRMTEPDMPAFGALCRAPAQNGRSHVIGLIYEISIEDDDLARQLAASEVPHEEARLDQQFVRPIPIEILALSVGYHNDDGYVYDLPPQPPNTLADIHSLTTDEVRRFTASFDFLPLVLAAPQLPTDSLLAAAFRLAAQARPEHEQRAFLVSAGRECARLLARDLTRLNNLVRSLQA